MGSLPSSELRASHISQVDTCPRSLDVNHKITGLAEARNPPGGYDGPDRPLTFFGIIMCGLCMVDVCLPQCDDKILLRLSSDSGCKKAADLPSLHEVRGN